MHSEGFDSCCTIQAAGEAGVGNVPVDPLSYDCNGSEQEVPALPFILHISRQRRT